jgi:hypothetical protein
VIVKESISFERGKDPKEALGIGLLSQLKNGFKKLQQEKTVGSITLKHFKDRNRYELIINYYGTIEGFTEILKKDVGTTYFFNWGRCSSNWKMYVKIKPEYYDLFIFLFDKNGSLKESVSFTRGEDPKKALGIGLESVIERYVDDNYVDRSSNEYIYWILKDEKLNRETKIEWVQFLLSRDYYVDEYDIAEMHDMNIDFLPYLKFESELYKYEYKDNKYILYFKEWETFIDFFDNESRSFIKEVLNGTAREYFIQHDISFEEVLNVFDYKKIEYDKLFQMAKDLGISNKKLNDIPIFLKELKSKPKFHDLYIAICIAIQYTYAMCDEMAAYKYIKYYILKEFKMKLLSEKFNEIITTEISKEGLQNLIYIEYTGYDKVLYKEPYNGYNGSFDIEIFNEELSNQLNNV